MENVFPIKYSFLWMRNEEGILSKTLTLKQPILLGGMGCFENYVLAEGQGFEPWRSLRT